MNSLELFIALRYLKARRKGVFTLLTTLIAVGGITLGVASLIITLAVMSGFHKDIRERILSLQPHLFVIKEDTAPFLEYEFISQKIKENKDVTAAAPFIYGQIILRKGQTTCGAVIKGIDFIGEKKLVGLGKILHNDLGQMRDNHIILGYNLAQTLGAGVGKDVIVVSPGIVGTVPKMQKFWVASIFKSGMYEYDSNMAYITLPAAQDLFELDRAVTGIGISLKNPDIAAETGKTLRKDLSFPYGIRTWQSMNGNLFAALKLEKIMMFIILTLIIVVAAFNIISNLLLLTVEKSKEIGILSAIGMNRMEIGRIFFFEGIIVGLAGIISGTALGTGVCYALHRYKFIHLPADIYYIDTLPVMVLPGDILSVVASALLIAVIAAVYPAYQATKLDPLDAIRYG
ncbi:MAG: ABC transporter permease [Elusimicrobiota bacterium]